MKKVSLEMLTTDQLVARYAAMGVAQYDALELDELSKYNRLFQRMMAIVNELKSRPGDGRHALLVLHHHPNAQVRLASAHATVPVARAESRAVFEQLIRAKEFPQAGDAGMAMRRLDDGTYGKPWAETAS